MYTIKLIITGSIFFGKYCYNHKETQRGREIFLTLLYYQVATLICVSKQGVWSYI